MIINNMRSYGFCCLLITSIQSMFSYIFKIYEFVNYNYTMHSAFKIDLCCMYMCKEIILGDGKSFEIIKSSC